MNLFVELHNIGVQYKETIHAASCRRGTGNFSKFSSFSGSEKHGCPEQDDIWGWLVCEFEKPIKKVHVETKQRTRSNQLCCWSYHVRVFGLRANRWNYVPTLNFLYSVKWWKGKYVYCRLCITILSWRQVGLRHLVDAARVPDWERRVFRCTFQCRRTMDRRVKPPVAANKSYKNPV